MYNFGNKKNSKWVAAIIIVLVVLMVLSTVLVAFM